MHGTFRRLHRPGERRAPVDLPPGATVRDALAAVGVDLAAPWNAALDGRLAGASDPVRDGSELVVFEPIAGG